VEEKIKGKVIKGYGIAKLIGWPTINILNETNTFPSIYYISHNIYGQGVAIVLNKSIEIHFLKTVNNFTDEYISVDILFNLFKDNIKAIPDNVIGILYKGILEERKMSPKNNNDFRKLDRAKDKIKLPKKKERQDWSKSASDNLNIQDDSVDVHPDDWLNFDDNSNESEGAD
jgi:hypothetical protein